MVSTARKQSHLLNLDIFLKNTEVPVKSVL